MTYSSFSFQHFVCAKCEKPFLGHRHYERKGLAYCETHYNQVLTLVTGCQIDFYEPKLISSLTTSKSLGRCTLFSRNLFLTLYLGNNFRLRS